MATAQFRRETSARGEFVRQPNRFTGRITAQSASAPGEGPDELDRWPLEAGRYRLIWSRACPWAHRAVIVRGLLGLQDAVSLGTVDPIRDERGWRFTLDPDGRDPVLGIEFLSEAYARTDPQYEGRVTVPALIDTLTGHVVSNDYPQITLDFSTDWAPLATQWPDLLPAHVRGEMEQLMQEIYEDVNNGVYRCGFATGQEAYEEAYDRLFARLDRLESRLASRRFLFGEHITEADVRLFTTLVRFDAVYHNHFKCNRNKLTEMPHLWRYARELFNTPGFGDTVDFDQIKRHYYGTHAQLNPSGIIPKGPDLAPWTA
ncbi:glutathione S-transferase family protein [Dactylosporangium sp. CA-233914]|uniref:glutathione S-transferase family protein n=1 Tax=Dactylosporangium sp. CA-233914 TaxID=3239934 RepID=UPI003D8F753A